MARLVSQLSRGWPPESDGQRHAIYRDHERGEVPRSELGIREARHAVWQAELRHHDTLEEAARFYSPLEGDLLAALWWYDLRPVLQEPFGPYRVDMFFPDEHVAVEVDGRGWHDRNHDVPRDRILRASHDVIVKRFSGRRIYSDPLGCAREVRGTVLWIRDRLHLVKGST